MKYTLRLLCSDTPHLCAGGVRFESMAPSCLWFRYKVPVMISLQISPHIYSSIREVTSKVATHLAQQCRHCWKHLWNCRLGIIFSIDITFFWPSSMSKNLGHCSVDLVLKEPKVTGCKIRRLRGEGVWFMSSTILWPNELTDSAHRGITLPRWRNKALAPHSFVFLPTSSSSLSNISTHKSGWLSLLVWTNKLLIFFSVFFGFLV